MDEFSCGRQQKSKILNLILAFAVLNIFTYLVIIDKINILI